MAEWLKDTYLPPLVQDDFLLALNGSVEDRSELGDLGALEAAFIRPAELLHSVLEPPCFDALHPR